MEELVCGPIADFVKRSGKKWLAIARWPRAKAVAFCLEARITRIVHGKRYGCALAGVNPPGLADVCDLGAGVAAGLVGVVVAPPTRVACLMVSNLSHFVSRYISPPFS